MKMIGAAAVLAAALMPVAASASKAPGWTGFYLGLHGGYDWVETEDSGLYAYDHDFDDLSGGIQAGYDHRLGNNLVIGLLLDLGLSSASGSRSTLDLVGGLPIVTQARTELESYGAVRARLGYAMGDVLPYVTGGIAWARYDVTYTQDFFGLGGTDIRETNGHIGWTAGAGLEYALTPSFSVKAEYLYADYGSDTYRGDFLGLPLAESIDLTTHNTRIGLNYRF
ncbi:MAG: porin family protein [Parvibaculum sp.]|nr:porin family protein [Parvibaculum sp.]